MRRKLAALPVVEKLRILDGLREREELIGRKLARTDGELQNDARDLP